MWEMLIRKSELEVQGWEMVWYGRWCRLRVDGFEGVAIAWCAVRIRASSTAFQSEAKSTRLLFLSGHPVSLLKGDVFKKAYTVLGKGKRQKFWPWLTSTCSQQTSQVTCQLIQFGNGVCSCAILSSTWLTSQRRAKEHRIKKNWLKCDSFLSLFFTSFFEGMDIKAKDRDGGSQEATRSRARILFENW